MKISLMVAVLMWCMVFFPIPFECSVACASGEGDAVGEAGQDVATATEVVAGGISAPTVLALDNICRCPEGYTVVLAGSLFCMGRPQVAVRCPKGTDFDGALGLCVSDVGADGLCPEGMERAMYGDRCFSDQLRGSECLPGGRYDAVLGLCIVPCNLPSSGKPDEKPSSD